MRSRNAAVLAVLSLVVLGCGSGSDESDQTVPVVTLITTTTLPAPETTVDDSAPVDTDAVESVAPSDSSPEPTSTTAAAPATDGSVAEPVETAPPVETTIATTTTEPVENRFTLSTDGIGTTSFGADPDGTVAFVSTFLGPPTADTGWVDPFTIGPCGGSQLRQVNWGSLQLEFGDASSITQGRPHFYAYTYGVEGSPAADPAGIETTEGITVGSTVGALIAAYPNVQFILGDEFISDNFIINDNLRGRLGGLTDADLVHVIIGGLPCEG